MYLPGYPPHPFPLSRHLPPLAEGVAAAYADPFSAPGDLVVDPFGQTPRVALELARAGRRVIAAASNPILRLALHASLDPVPAQHLLTVLTRLADSRLAPPRAGLAADRLEAYVRRVYRSTCPDCGSEVDVDVFHWEKETLAEKSYYCEACHAERTRPADAADMESASRIPARGPHYHWALERVAPPGDPDRSLLVDALEAYTPRALSVIFTLTHKGASLDLDPPQRRALELLLLMAYDEGISLEGQRPRSLKPHVKFREKNIWLALERLARDSAWQSDGGAAVSIRPTASVADSISPAVALHDGSIRDLSRTLPPNSIPCMIAALPRPNLVLWTLSAVWAGWLWGEPAARPLRHVIRRRYDWAWHESALRSGFGAAHTLLAKGSRLVALMPEAEALFTAAALTAADGAGFTLIRHAVRHDPSEGQFVFQPDSITLDSPDDLAAAIRRRAESSALAVLRERGEPSRWRVVSSAAFVSLAHDHFLRLAIDDVANDPLDHINDQVEAACLDSQHLTHVRASETETESVRAANAWWWLTPSGEAEAQTPLADRVEHEVARALAATIRTGADLVSIERRVCEALSGFTEPDGNLIRQCLNSYGEEKGGLWFFRPEDNPLDRAGDFDQLIDDLAALGRRLGYTVESKQGDEVEWRAAQTGVALYHFFVTDSAEISRYIGRPASGGAQRAMVIPGGRAGLVDFKLKRDPFLRAAVEAGHWLFVKFRHVRRLLQEPALDPLDLGTILNRDPITEQTSTQLPLL